MPTDEPPFNSQWVAGNIQPMNDPYEEAARRRATANDPPSISRRVWLGALIGALVGAPLALALVRVLQ